MENNRPEEALYHLEKIGLDPRPALPASLPYYPDLKDSPADLGYIRKAYRKHFRNPVKLERQQVYRKARARGGVLICFKTEREPA